MNRKSLISAALVGGTFLFISSNIWADVPIVQSQADHVASSGDAVPLNRESSGPQVGSALIEDLIFRLDELTEIIAEQQNRIETLEREVSVMQQEQKVRYVDLDGRIQVLMSQKSSSAVTETSKPVDPVAQEALSDEDILAEFNNATTLIKQKKVDEAISSFAVFAKKYPDHPLTPNAWYWIAEIYRSQRKIEDSQGIYERIVRDYPSHARIPESLYKLGVIAQQSSDSALAKQYFERVISEYPNTQSAKQAKARLSSN